jgi:thiamine-phosphate pyrophosphorylase
MFSFSTRLYAITNTQLSGLSLADQVAQLSQGGARLVQLREKHLAPREFCRDAEVAVRIARTNSTRIIINDRADIARALQADGVHLGQDDLPPEAARRLLGPDAVIGVSTHNVQQAQRASKMPIDYIAIGPIFPTQTKVNAEPLVGLNSLRRIREVIGAIPIVAIGGITAENAGEVISAGADAVALISGLFLRQSSLQDRTRELLASL